MLLGECGAIRTIYIRNEAILSLATIELYPKSSLNIYFDTLLSNPEGIRKIHQKNTVRNSETKMFEFSFKSLWGTIDQHFG